MPEEQRTTVLTVEQQQRVEALRTARSILASSSGPLTTSTAGRSIEDFIVTAEYIVAGKRPHDRYSDEEGSSVMAAPGPITMHFDEKSNPAEMAAAARRRIAEDFR